MMRSFTLIALIIAFATKMASAENYFSPGTVWTLSLPTSVNEGDILVKGYGKLLDPIEYKGEEVMPYVRFNPETGEMQPENFYVRSEGDKVFFRPKKVEDPEMDHWYLIYDFGLQPGETAAVSSLWFKNNGQLANVYGFHVECIETNVSDSDIFGECMNLKYTFDSEISHDSFDVTWIMGAGNPMSMEYPCESPIPNIGTIEVTSADGELLFGYKAYFISDNNFFRPGTVWIDQQSDSMNQEPGTSKKYFKLLDTREDVGINAMPYVSFDPETGESSEPKYYVRSAWDKVYFRPIEVAKPELDRWYLVYDFSLQPGDHTAVYTLKFDGNKLVDTTGEYVECISSDESLEDMTGKFMRLKHYSKTEKEVIWIMGAGNIANMQYPVGVPEESNYVMEVTTADGDVVFKSGVTKVAGIETDNVSVTSEGLTIVVDGLDADQPVTIYNLDGASVAEGKGSCRLTMTEKNVYIVKAGSFTFKVVV